MVIDSTCDVSHHDRWNTHTTHIDRLLCSEVIIFGKGRDMNDFVIRHISMFCEANNTLPMTCKGRGNSAPIGKAEIEVFSFVVLTLVGITQ